MTTILILGGTGKTGRRVACHLRRAGHPVRTAARTGGDVPFDLGEPATWAPALDGAVAAYVVEPALQTGAGRARIRRFAEAAVAAGAQRLVLLSAPAAGRPEHPLHDAEQAVRESGAGWTVLRPNWFAQNFCESFWRAGILDGTLYLPTGDGRTPFIDAEDIAEVAAAALTGDRHDGRTYELTGPRALGFGEAAGLIGAATGRAVRHVDITPETFTERQIAAGVAPETARLLAGVLTQVREGGLGTTPTGDVELALGRPPRRFEDYVTDAAASGRWRP
ncbi:NAD(P)H-binding protein [Amycolatopsis sp. NPDC088138]|uniref:NmrA family NAD(P)-binding protein n=1 Tax=Amycolatopsis sp. NPDC088138 TaxID=3363938 RepID=UPI003802172A